MDRSSLLRIVGIALAVLLFWKYGLPLFTGKSGDTVQVVPTESYVNAPDFVPDVLDPAQPGVVPAVAQGGKPPDGAICKLKGNRFDAELSSRGAALTHLFLRDPQYAGTDGFDMSTTPDHERWRSLRTLFRDPAAFDQLKYDRFNWTLDESTGKSCRFSYADDDVRIVKTIDAGERPFELNVQTTLTNLTNVKRRHHFAIEAFAYRTNAEIKGRLGRVSPFQTELSCARGKEVVRKGKDDFKEGWFSEPLVDRYAAVSNYYFAQALVPVLSAGDDKPECALLAEDWYSSGQKRDDDRAGDVYHAGLSYPARELEPNQSVTYTQIGYFGPKERNVLALAAGGRGLGDLINLGFFSPVAKVLVSILLFFRTNITFGNWGLAIIAMTVCLRLLMLPLSIKPIKTSMAMRRLKPEMDAITKKFEDDLQAKNMAMMELYRKHGVNPLGGCLPQLVQMPIWFAMYTTLQTAVEMYHEKFLWFTDLSAPDKIFILPIVLGAFMILQQRIVPQQGMDPMQQKMMMYLLPGVFTVMMLFLPAALGVYMLTNSVLGITQQLVVERIAPRNGPTKGASPAKGEITVREKSGLAPTSGSAPRKERDGEMNDSFGKGKARV
jgi:YidC/Oxa1 family membrane protein insertase